MINAYLLIDAEPARLQDLVEELADMKLDHTVVKSVHAVAGQFNLIAYVEAPSVPELGECVTQGIAEAVGIRRIETNIVIW
ncbi:MAG: Lrp/AsnC family transcriptional regulator [Chloroflexi bacterium]|nr:Lrp/AsnC family transcriptional regulator [Chloroflexota bacterium]